MTSELALSIVGVAVAVAGLPMVVLPGACRDLLHRYTQSLGALRLGSVAALAIGLVLAAAAVTGDASETLLGRTLAAIVGAISLAKGTLVLVWPAAYGKMVRQFGARSRDVFLWGLAAFLIGLVFVIVLPRYA